MALYESVLSNLDSPQDISFIIDEKTIEDEEKLKSYMSLHNDNVTAYRQEVLQTAIEVSMNYNSKLNYA